MKWTVSIREPVEGLLVFDLIFILNLKVRLKRSVQYLIDNAAWNLKVRSRNLMFMKQVIGCDEYIVELKLKKKNFLNIKSLHCKVK